MFCLKEHYVLIKLFLLNVLINEIDSDQYESLKANLDEAFIYRFRRSLFSIKFRSWY